VTRETQLPERDRAAVLLHGLCGSSTQLRTFGGALREFGFHIVTPTLNGYSEPDIEATREKRKPSFKRWIADATSEIDRVAETYSEVYLCGVSLGATLALAVAAERATKLDALSLISTTLFFDGWNVSRWRFLLPIAYYTPLGHLYHYREAPPFGVKNERVRAWIAENLRRDSVASVATMSISAKTLLEAHRLIGHVTACLGRVRTPTLIIHAREDDLASLANMRYVRKHIGAAICNEIIVENSYHMITIDNDCDYTAAKTANFFNAAAKKRDEATRSLSRLTAVPGRRP
jgi:carboxylesterase